MIEESILFSDTKNSAIIQVDLKVGYTSKMDIDITCKWRFSKDYVWHSIGSIEDSLSFGGFSKLRDIFFSFLNDMTWHDDYECVSFKNNDFQTSLFFIYYDAKNNLLGLSYINSQEKKVDLVPISTREEMESFANQFMFAYKLSLLS